MASLQNHALWAWLLIYVTIQTWYIIVYLWWYFAPQYKWIHHDLLVDAHDISPKYETLSARNSTNLWEGQERLHTDDLCFCYIQLNCSLCIETQWSWFTYRVEKCMKIMNNVATIIKMFKVMCVYLYEIQEWSLRLKLFDYRFKRNYHELNNSNALSSLHSLMEIGN